jgi:hypothetical protein
MSGSVWFPLVGPSGALLLTKRMYDWMKGEANGGIVGSGKWEVKTEDRRQKTEDRRFRILQRTTDNGQLSTEPFFSAFCLLLLTS